MALVNPFGEPIDVTPDNITTKFREAFEAYTANVLWLENRAPGDIIQLDGNAASASYLVISKDPLTAGTESTLTSNVVFNVPIETAVGLGISQRILGNDFALELISNETPIAEITDIAIANVIQSTTTLTVNTTSAHNLVPGKRIGIKDVTDSRLNYPSLVVASIPTPTRFTATAGPMGTIGSVTTGLLNGGNVYFRPAMGYARNGMSLLFENTTATNGSYYLRSDSGDSYPTGTIVGNHSVTIGTSASNQAINSPYTYAWFPTTEYRFNLQSDRAQLYDVAVDSSAATSNRALRTQVIPDTTKQYRLRVRAINQKSITIPNGKIISAVKTGTVTANIQTDGPHGLTSNDYVVVYGIRDQTNFATQSTPVKVVDVPGPNNINVSFSAAVTATSYGGMIARAQSNIVPAAFLTQAVQSAAVASNELTLVGSASWSGVSIGDYINVYGVKDIVSGADLLVDGTYKAANVSGVTLVGTPIGSTVLPTPFATTNAGGVVIRRSDIRISFARIYDYTRHRIEWQNRPADAVAGIAVVGAGGTISTVSTVSTASLAYNNLVNDVTSAALTSTTSTSAVTPAASTISQEFNVIVTAVSGTNQTLDVVVQESDDSGTNWYDIYHFPRITAVGQYRSPMIPATGNRIRYVQTVAGSSPSFTRSINRIQSHLSAPIQKQFFDRVIALNTLNSNTLPYFTDGCSILNAVVNVGNVVVTAPNVVLEGSAEGLANTWYRLGSELQTANNTLSYITVTDALPRFARVRVSAAGVGANLNYVMIKGASR